MKAFPYDSVVTYDADGKPIYDRFVLAETERAMNRKLFTSGIFANPLGAEVTVHSGMTVSVSPFTFMIDGVKGIEEFTTQWTLDVGGSLSRYDRIVLRNDNSTSTRFPNITILKGTPASSPTAPPITRSGDIYDLVFATIFVGAQATELTNEKIEDDRLDSDLCGVVTQAIDSVDTTTIFNQLQAQVDDNIALIQSAVDETTAGNLQGQIDTNISNIDRLSGELLSGWTKTNNTFFFASADDNTFICSATLNGVISVGMKIRLTQGSVKYFIVTAISENTITLYGGTDYELLDDSITDVYFSTSKCPYGFPTSPTKWTEIYIKASNSTIGSTAKNVWTPTIDSLTVPIGAWKLSAKYAPVATVTSAYGSILYSALSKSTASPTNPQMNGYASENNDTIVLGQFSFQEDISIEEKETFTIIIKTIENATSVGTTGSSNPTVIKAVCAYL